MIDQYTNPLRLFVARFAQTTFLFEPDAASGLVAVTPDTTIVNSVYVSEHGTSDQALRRASQELASGRTFLWLRECPDGPPYRTGVLFRRDTDGYLPNRRMMLSGTEVDLEGYFAATAMGHHFTWANDLLTGRRGFFVTGFLNAPELWRIVRVDTDIAQRFLFTVAPIRLASGLPSLRSDRISDQLLRAEAEAHWVGLQSALASLQFYNAITSAKNVAEAALAHAVPSPPGSSGNRTLDKVLSQLKMMIETKQNTTALDTLDYHLLHMLRELHARTHPERSVVAGRPIDPALALATAPALARVLGSLNLID